MEQRLASGALSVKRPLRYANRFTHLATAITVGAGMVPVLSQPDPAIPLAIGAALLAVTTVGAGYAEGLGSSRAQRLYFGVAYALCVMLLTMSNGMAWFAALPLISQTVLFLSLARAVVAGAVLVGLLVHWLPSGDVTAADVVGGSGSAVIFVLVFSVIARREVEWRLRSEELGADLRAANEKLVSFAAEVADLSAVQERNRMAREVHDGLGHYLTAIHVQLEAAKALLDSGDDLERARKGVDHAQNLARQGLRDVRTSVALLRDDRSAEQPATELLGELVERNREAGVPVTLRVEGEPRPLPDATAHTLMRVAQEGLTNAVRHAEAQRIDVGLRFDTAAVALTVQDDGVGSGDESGGFGLIGVRERVRLLGGSVRCSAPPGGGFSLEVELPL